MTLAAVTAGTVAASTVAASTGAASTGAAGTEATGPAATGPAGAQAHQADASKVASTSSGGPVAVALDAFAQPLQAAGAMTASKPLTPRQIARSMLKSHGWTTGQFSYLNRLWKHESGWNPRASNPYSGAYGIPQAVPGSKMASCGRNWRTNPRTQIRWGLHYIKMRYKSPHGAWLHEVNYGWY
jgi:hypothetical protein